MPAVGVQKKKVPPKYILECADYQYATKPKPSEAWLLAVRPCLPGASLE